MNAEKILFFLPKRHEMTVVNDVELINGQLRIRIVSETSKDDC